MNRPVLIHSTAQRRYARQLPVLQRSMGACSGGAEYAADTPRNFTSQFGSAEREIHTTAK